MSSDQHKFDELAQWCGALVDGTLTNEQQVRLTAMLNESEPARRFYVHYLGLSAGLFEYAAESQFTDSASPPKAFVTKRKSARLWFMAALAIAATALIALLLNRGSDRSSEADAEGFAAQITGLQACVWTVSGQSPALGEPLLEGRQLALESGIAEITFDCGAQVVLEGPARLDLNSAWEATLRQGKLHATVPTEATGFGIQTSAVDVVDLGTEFCVSVDAAGVTDVGVLQGAVEVTERAAGKTTPTKLLLREQNARRFNRGKSEEIESVANFLGQFKKPTKLQRPAKGAKFVHWTFNEVDGLAAHGERSPTIEIVRRDLSGEPWADGYAGRALKLGGEFDARASVAGIAERTPHTIAFWVRIPDETSAASSGPMVAWLATAENVAQAQMLQIGCNGNAAFGPLGALRTDIGRASFIGTTPLRDDRWHHIAVVAVPKNGGKLRWNVRQYVDGHLEATTIRASKPPRFDLVDEPTDEAIWLGCLPGKERPQQGRFRGMLDELYVIDGVLPPQQVRQLFRRNALAAMAPDDDD